MWLHQLKLESARIFGLKRNIVFFALFCLLGFFFVYSGVTEYQHFLKEKTLFLTHERNKVNLYVTYSHYGDYGFRVLCDPSPLSIFFNNSSVFENLSANVDMTEILDINTSYKGRNLLLRKGYFKDLAGMLFTFGSLFMIYMGMTAFASEKIYFKFCNVLIRLGILSLFFMLLMFCLYQFPRFFHLPFSPHDGKVFFSFALYLLLFLAFFYGAGLFIRILSGRKPITFIYVFIFWILSISIIPEIMTILLQQKAQQLPPNEKHNIAKLKEVMNFEREVRKAIQDVKILEQRNEIYQQMVKHFLKTGYIKNSRIEKAINRDIRQMVGKYEKTLLIYPTSFYHYLSGEVSGKGYHGYLELVNYTLSLRHRFVQYYLQKRYQSNDKAIVPFVQKDENIFHTRSFLPAPYPVASGITLLYTFLFFVFSYGIIRRRARRMPDLEKPAYKFRKGNTYFVLCQDDGYRENLFRCYQADRDIAVLDQLKVEELDPGVSLAQMVTYFCHFSGVDEEKVWENLRWLGIEEEAKKSWKNRHPGEQVPGEVIHKIYCAVTLAGNREIIVINDFLKGKSREMERQFLDLVSRLNDAGKIVVYLSSDIFLTSSPFEGNIKVDHFKTFRIDPQAVSLR